MKTAWYGEVSAMSPRAVSSPCKGMASTDEHRNGGLQDRYAGRGYAPVEDPDGVGRGADPAAATRLSGGVRRHDDLESDGDFAEGGLQDDDGSAIGG
jgi:hypothetical protein